jgi:hypothetical protein
MNNYCLFPCIRAKFRSKDRPNLLCAGSSDICILNVADLYFKFVETKERESNSHGLAQKDTRVSDRGGASVMCPPATRQDFLRKSSIFGIAFADSQ